MSEIKPLPYEDDLVRNSQSVVPATGQRELGKGRVIHVRLADTPPGHVVRKHPDGRTELVRVDMATGKMTRVG